MSSTRGGNSFRKEVNPLHCLLPHSGRSFTSLPDGPSANGSIFANDHLSSRALPSPFFDKKTADAEKQCSSPQGSFPAHNKAQRNKGNALGATDNRISPLACMIPSKRNGPSSNIRHVAKNDSVDANKPSELQMDVKSLFTSCIDLGVVSVRQRNSVVTEEPSKQLHTMTRKDKKKFRRVRHYLGKITRSEDTVTLLKEGSDSDTDEDEDSLSTENSSVSSIPSLSPHSVEEERDNERLDEEKVQTNTNQKVEKGRISNVMQQQQRSVHFHTWVSVYEYPPVNSVVVSRKQASYYPKKMAPIREENQSNLCEGARSI